VAGDWIKMRLDLMEDPAVMEMADRLGVREETVVGYCHAFWSWVSRQCHAESVTGVTLLSLGRRLNLPGFPELLCDVGWLEYDDTGDKPVIRIPNFDRHLSESAKKRALSTNRQRNKRSDVTQVSRSERDKSVTREEKKREEKSNTHTHTAADGFEESWIRWCQWRESQTGRPVDPIQADSLLMELNRRGAEKAARDIDFSIRKGARTVLDSDNDFEKRSSAGKRSKLPL